MKNNEHGLRGFIQSFRCAVAGIMSGIVNERNLRIHIIVACYTLFFSTFYKFTRGEYILLVMTISLVIATEMLNTAIEAAVDLVTEKYALHAKAAKDIAAGAVLVTSCFSVIVGLLLFWDVETFKEIIEHYIRFPWRIVLLCLSIVCSVLFILKIGKWTRKADRYYAVKNGGNHVQNKE